MLNDLLISMGRNRGATLSILALDPQAEELEAVTAGHLPPLLIDTQGCPRLLEQRHGLQVGVRSGNEYEGSRHPFPIGSRLLLYTDGLIERRGESIDRGFERLTIAAEAAAREPKTNLADDVYRALLDSTPLADDVALLAIETLPLDDPLEITLPARADVLAGMRRTLARWLRAAGADEDEQFDITLSVSEAAANAIEHAYGGNEATFTVICEHESDRITVTVRDLGRWRTTRPPGGGRGLSIMRELVDDVKISRGDEGTVVKLIKGLSGSA